MLIQDLLEIRNICLGGTDYKHIEELDEIYEIVDRIMDEIGYSKIDSS